MEIGLRKRIFKWLTGRNADEVLNVNMISHPYMSDPGFNDNYLFDFKNYAAELNRMSGGTIMIPSTQQIVGGNHPDSEPQFKGVPQKIKIKPVDVLQELETVPTPFGLALLDEKITILKDKEALINQSYSKREITALIQRLENRKKYPDHREYFDKFQNTTDEKIDLILNKYELVMKSADIFIPEFPDEAVIKMKEYSQAMMAICEKKPIFYVIAEEQMFKKAYEKRDPILLVQSPFGFYWQILGAWDKEMLLLSEL